MEIKGLEQLVDMKMKVINKKIGLNRLDPSVLESVIGDQWALQCGQANFGHLENQLLSPCYPKLID